MIEIKLDEPCWSCSGTGSRFDSKTSKLIERGGCIYCHGTGLSFTNVGQLLAHWLELHYGLTPVTKPEQV